MAIIRVFARNRNGAPAASLIQPRSGWTREGTAAPSLVCLAPRTLTAKTCGRGRLWGRVIFAEEKARAKASMFPDIYIFYFYLHLTHDKWHVTPDTWNMTCDKWWGMNNIPKCQLPRFYGLCIMLFWRFRGKRSPTDSMNQLQRWLLNSPGYTGSVKNIEKDDRILVLYGLNLCSSWYNKLWKVNE